MNRLRTKRGLPSARRTRCWTNLAAAAGVALAFGWGATAHAVDRSVSVSLSDDLKPNPLVFRGKMDESMKLNRSGLPLNRRNKKCRYMAYVDVPRVPQVVLTLARKKRIFVDPFRSTTHAAVYIVSEDRRSHFCADRLGRGFNFDLRPGRWMVYVAPRSVSKRYKFKLGDATRPIAVPDAPSGTPEFVVGASFKPNPLVIRPTLQPPATPVEAEGFGARCGEKATVDQRPSFILRLREDRSARPLTIFSGRDYVLFDLQKGKAHCVYGRGTRVKLRAGTHYAYAILGRRDHYGRYRGRGHTEPTETWMAIRDARRPLQYVIAPDEGNTTTLPARLTQPVVISGVSRAARRKHPLVRGRCAVLPAVPDFYLRTSAPLEDLRIQPLGTTGRIRLVGPVDRDGVLQASARARWNELRRKLRCLRGSDGSRARAYGRKTSLNGLYAAYVVGKASEPQHYALRVLGSDGERAGLARAAAPRPGMSLAERAVHRWYPDLHLRYRFEPSWFAKNHKFWMDVPRELIVFVGDRRKVGGLKAGTPLVVWEGGRRVSVISPDGGRYAVDAKDLVLAPPGAIALPQPRRSKLYESDLPKFLEGRKKTSFLRRQQKFKKCFDRVMDKLDPDGVAGRYNVVTYRRGRVVKIEGMAARYRRTANRRCGGRSYDRYVARVAKKESSKLKRLEASRLEAVRDRIERLFKDGGPTARGGSAEARTGETVGAAAAP